jgi:hypothetical protein
MDTHPMPMPSARAASHRVWTAATAEYSLISGIVWRPRPWPRAVSRSAKTARWQGASSSPASFSGAYCAARSGSCPASASALQVSKLRRTAARRSGSSTRINRQGWLSPTDGARQASSSTFSIEPCGSGSGRNRRTSRRQISNSRNLARKAASNAGTGGIAISVHQLPQYGTRRLAAPQPRQRREAAFVGESRISSVPQPEYAGWGTLIRDSKYLLEPPPVYTIRPPRLRAREPGTSAPRTNSAPAGYTAAEQHQP